MENIIIFYIYKISAWCADLADLQLISTFNKGIRFLLWVIDMFSKYTLVIPLKCKKDTAFTNSFQEI